MIDRGPVVWTDEEIRESPVLEAMLIIFSLILLGIDFLLSRLLIVDMKTVIFFGGVGALFLATGSLLLIRKKSGQLVIHKNGILVSGVFLGWDSIVRIETPEIKSPEDDSRMPMILKSPNYRYMTKHRVKIRLFTQDNKRYIYTLNNKHSFIDGMKEAGMDKLLLSGVN